MVFIGNNCSMSTSNTIILEGSVSILQKSKNNALNSFFHCTFFIDQKRVKPLLYSLQLVADLWRHEISSCNK